MNIKKLTAALTAITLCASAMPFSIASYNYSVNTATAAEVGGFDNNIPADKLPEWVPKSYDSAKEYMSKVDTSSLPNEVNFSYAAGYIMFVWHVKPENNHGFLFSTDIAKYAVGQASSTNKYEYFSQDGTDEYVVFVYNYTQISQKAYAASHLYIYNNEQKETSGRYILNASVDTDLSFNPISLTYKKSMTANDWEKIANNGGAAVVDNNVCLAFDKSLGSTKLTVNGAVKAMAQTSKASDTGKYYNIFNYEPTEPGKLKFVVEITDSNGKTTTKTINLVVDSNMNVSQDNSGSDEDKDEFSWLPKTFADAENFISTNGNVAVSEDYVVLATKYGQGTNYKLEQSTDYGDFENFELVKETTVTEGDNVDDGNAVNFKVYKPKNASDSYLEWKATDYSGSSLFNIYFADVTVDSNLKIKLNSESDSSWYPTDVNSAQAFMEKYPTGGSVGNTACYVSKDVLSITNKQLFSNFNIKNYKYYGGYTVTLIKATDGETGSDELYLSYENKTITLSVESDYDEATKTTSCKITNIKEKEILDEDSITFKKVDDLYKEYGNSVFSEGMAFFIVPIENGKSAPELKTTGNGKSVKKFEKTVTDGNTTYAFYFLEAAGEGDVNVTIPLDDKKALKAYLLVEKSDSEEFAYKFVTNPNPTEEPTTEPTTGSDVVITVVSGDVNLDNDVTIADAVLLNKYLVKSATLNEAQEAAADAYNDGKLDSTDTLTILKFIVGTYDQLPQKP